MAVVTLLARFMLVSHMYYVIAIDADNDSFDVNTFRTIGPLIPQFPFAELRKNWLT